MENRKNLYLFDSTVNNTFAIIFDRQSWMCLFAGFESLHEYVDPSSNHSAICLVLPSWFHIINPFNISLPYTLPPEWVLTVTIHLCSLWILTTLTSGLVWIASIQTKYRLSNLRMRIVARWSCLGRRLWMVSSGSFTSNGMLSGGTTQTSISCVDTARYWKL